MRGNLLPAASTVLDGNELFFDKGAQSAGICGEVDVKLCAGRFALQIENTGTVIDMKLNRRASVVVRSESTTSVVMYVPKPVFFCFAILASPF